MTAHGLKSLSCALLFFASHLLPVAAAADSGTAVLEVSPAEVTLKGHFDQLQLVVRNRVGDGVNTDTHDVTHAADYQTSAADVVTVSETGRLTAIGNGRATITITAGDRSATIPVTVTGITDQPVVDFDTHVRPIISRLGCNAGACHASQFGKGDFVLSVFGYDAKKDFNSIVRDRSQRRVNLLSPEESLVLKKPTMQVPHGGGLRLTKDSVLYQTLVAWIAAGAPGPNDSAPTVKRVEVFPAEVVSQPGATAQLRVTAHYSDDTSRDVTHWARFDSTDDAVLSVTPDGFVTVEGKGQAPVMVRFEGQAAMAMFVVPYGPAPSLEDWDTGHPIDIAASRKFRQLGIEPSGLCSDETFIRRAFLDATGTLPTVEEMDAYLALPAAERRTAVIDELLGLTGDPERDRYNDRYTALWTLKWSDLLRNTSNGQAADQQRMWAMYNWIRESFRTNKPFDQFVRELITAKGSIYSSGPASFFRINSNSSDLAEATAQLFLGVRLQCAKCHHHPFEKYSQADYYSFAAFFSRVGNKNSQEFGLFGRESVVMVRSSGSVRHPRTGKTMNPKPLDGEEVDHPLDRRIPLAQWLTSEQNRDFARSVANRYVRYLLGRGLVEPVDDMRATNPPTNPQMLDAIADHFVEQGFDLKQLMRLIMTSRLYHLSSAPTVQNRSDDRFYSHFYVKRLSAEVLLDAVDDATGSRTRFKGLPAGTRAIDLPDGEYPNYFLTTFGKPKRVSVCECERVPDENLGQALHTLNGDILASKISDPNGRVAALLKSTPDDREAIVRLYRTVLCRRPTDAEVSAALKYRSQTESRAEFFEDLMWSLLNSKQFLFVH